MADSTSFNKLELPSPVRMRAPKPAKERSPKAKRAAGFFAWVALLTAGIAAIAPLSHFTMQEMELWSLQHADDETVARALEQDWPRSTSPDYLETLAELGLQLPVVDTGSAYVAAQRATSIDPSRAFVWAELAYLEMKRADDKVNEASLNALTKSMDACPLCSEELIAWRFNFVLANWNAIPEALRRRAFEQADLLRWIGPNAEILAEMSVKARQKGIPFDAYRAAVNTPARTWDIGPQARTAKLQGST